MLRVKYAYLTEILIRSGQLTDITKCFDPGDLRFRQLRIHRSVIIHTSKEYEILGPVGVEDGAVNAIHRHLCSTDDLDIGELLRKFNKRLVSLAFGVRGRSIARARVLLRGPQDV